MAGFEYKVVPAPTKGLKAKGMKTADDRFAHALQSLMNTLGVEGWEYQRADTLPSTERAGLTGSQTVWRHVLVFRRAVAVQQQAEQTDPAPEPLKLEDKTKSAETPPPVPTQDTDNRDADDSAPQQTQDTKEHTDAADTDQPAGQPGATQMLRDNGVEETSEVSGPSASLSALAKNRKSPLGSDV